MTEDNKWKGRPGEPGMVASGWPGVWSSSSHAVPSAPKGATFSPPSLPKGGGAMQGIDAKFTANPATGTASLAIPIATSRGRAGSELGLMLGYDSGAGNSPFGGGWRLSMPAITRKTDKGLPHYLDGQGDAPDTDVFLLPGVEDLVPERVPGEKTFCEWREGEHLVRCYRPRVEAAFTRIERWTHQPTGEIHWRTTTGDNTTSIFGRSLEARVADPARPERVFSWLLEETRDDRGNVVRYTYKAEDGAGVDPGIASEANRFDWTSGRPRAFQATAQLYLKRILYGNRRPGDASGWLFEVVFDYGEHDETTPTPDEVRAWDLRRDPFSTYRARFEVRTYRLCRRVLMFHHMPELGEAPCLVRSTDFAYDESPVLTQLVAATHSGYTRAPGTPVYAKKSYPPIELGYAIPWLETELRALDQASTEDLPGGVQGTSQWVDLDGEGLPGVLTQQGGALFYKQNLGGGELAKARLLMRTPSMGRSSAAGPQVSDIDGDGHKEIVFFEPPMLGYHERTDHGFSPFYAFPSQPRINWNDINLRFIDLSGDGHADVLIAGVRSFTWYPSLAKGGFDKPIILRSLQDEEKGPAVVFADGTRTIFLADMTGDGLTDIVRIQNHNVCYWPNLGYGRFGAKVQMSNAPWFDNPDMFDPRRIRLADVDGSGTTDILYLHRDGVRIYANQAGNSLARAIELPCFPDMSDLSTIAAVDLLGTGTACLVWSSGLPGLGSRSVGYIDLLGSKKPYLLTSYRNNLGLEVRLEYAPSTRFYLEDAAAGQPWITKLPFPVHVLTRVETYDAISHHRFVTTYAYHHGFYDGVEREFRGFGRVDQRDTESFSTFSGKDELPRAANASDTELHLPPVHTKTWLHTGAWAAGEKVARRYAHEYYAGDAQASATPDTLLPSRLSTDEEREACRALKGQILRQETYAEDGSVQAPHPYVVSERSYEVRRLQARTKNIHGVFFVHPREAIEYHYERNPSDPRITHAFTLEVDAFGAIRRSAAVGYPRRAANARDDEQRKVAITLSETDVFHHAPAAGLGWVRLGVPIETRTYELTGVKLAADAVFSFKEMLAAAGGSVAVPYEATPDGSLQKRLLAQARTLYSRDDLKGALPLGQVESLALPFQGYAKAFSPELVGDVLQGRATDDILREGGYVKLEGDADWWIPSGRQAPSKDDFYLPIAFIDPFGNHTSVAYDAYRLLVTQATDPVQNVVTAAYDYRVLSPTEVTDPNGNRTQARFDALGMVAATAVMGNEGSGEGDTLDDPTTTFEYDLDRYRRTGKPSVVLARAREQHGAENTRWQESYNYSDGAGHEVMHKVQAEPGPAPQRDGTGALVHDAQGKLVVANTKPRWVGTGRTVLDNKGNPVKQYEPFFSATAEYEDEAELCEWGVTPILRYDPLGRLIRTDLPNGIFSRVVFDPWKEMRFDPNDTVLESAWYRDRQRLDPSSDPEGRAAKLASAHANTPTVVHLDVLGRPFLTVADNGASGQYKTHVALDIEGNPLTMTDARGVVAMQQRFGMGGQKLWQKSCDAGERWMLADVGGAMLRAWDARGFIRRMVYDGLRRATHLYVHKDAAPEILAERRVYGEALLDAAARNLRGKAYQVYGSEGVVTSELYDFKGNLLENQRRLAADYHAQVDWSVIGGLTNGGGIKAATEPLLEAEVFAEQTTYDALNRPVSLTAPDASEIRPTYNEASLLEKVEARIRGAAAWTMFVDHIDYDAKGQRERIVYGNGTRTTYTYDPLTFRLARLKTVRDADGAVLQNLSYTHDPVGNITEIKDSAQQTVFFNNEVVSPSARYVYDALYRLTQAIGREHAGGIGDVQRDQNDLPLMNVPHTNDAQALRTYVESYEQDAVGNLLKMIHQAGVGSWTRRYAYELGSNRLSSTSLPGDPEGGPYSGSYGHDAHGNMTSMPHLASIGWDFRDQMRTVDLGGGGTAYYVNDAAGQRVRKVIERIGTLIEERIYLGGYEVYRKRDHTGVLLERETLHIMDDKQRIALVETKTLDASTTTPRVRYQFGNHLGSAVLEVNEAGQVISYEEYHPYGTSAYHSARNGVEVSARRYRYTGKERDEETGLYYHGARYYAPWLGRWTAADPAGPIDGPDLYMYVRGSPIGLSDPSGREAYDNRKPRPDVPAPAPGTHPPVPPPPPLKTEKPAPEPKPKQSETDKLRVPEELLKAADEGKFKFSLEQRKKSIVSPQQARFVMQFFLYAVDELVQRGISRRNALLLVAHSGVETSYGTLGPNPPHNNFLSFQPKRGPQQEAVKKMGVSIISEKRINKPGEEPDDTPVPHFTSTRQSLQAQLDIAYGIGRTDKLAPFQRLGKELSDPNATVGTYAGVADKSHYSGTPYSPDAALPSQYRRASDLINWALGNLPVGMSEETRTWVEELRKDLAPSSKRY